VVEAGSHFVPKKFTCGSLLTVAANITVKPLIYSHAVKSNVIIIIIFISQLDIK